MKTLVLITICLTPLFTIPVFAQTESHLSHFFDCPKCKVPMEIPSQIRITKEGGKENTRLPRMPTVFRCSKCGYSEYKNYN